MPLAWPLLFLRKNGVVSPHQIAVHQPWLAEKEAFQLLEAAQKDGEKTGAGHDDSTSGHQQDEAEQKALVDVGQQGRRLEAQAEREAADDSKNNNEYRPFFQGECTSFLR
ncbi:hypothetical protein D478_19224 [Brevibacillus agri BAB-2500]|nr:hypothetical protein D478_19224 [Brevibacillus agri BAB-2500]